MLNKVLKYDLKTMGKNMFYGYAVVLVLSILTKLLSVLANKITVFSVAYSLSIFVFILSIVGIFLYYLLISITSFYKDFASKKAYLIQMLPINKNTLISSKLIISTLYLVITILVILLSLFINFYDENIINNVKIFVDNFASQLNVSFIFIIIYFVLSILLGNISNILMCYAAISLGQKHTNKLTYSFVYGVIIYTLSQIISTIFILILAMISPNIDLLSNKLDNSYVMQTLILSLALSVILSIIYYLITYKSVKNKLSL